jgi:diaminopimelate decarboxylase
MKPMGPIPQAFGCTDGVMTIGGQRVDELVSAAGSTPLFVYDFQLIKRNISQLKSAMPPQLAVHFAVKANPLPALVNMIAPLVDGLDVASGGELGVALATGTKHISFAGPGKTAAELTAALASSIWNQKAKCGAHWQLPISSENGQNSLCGSIPTLT